MDASPAQPFVSEVIEGRPYFDSEWDDQWPEGKMRCGILATLTDEEAERLPRGLEAGSIDVELIDIRTGQIYKARWSGIFRQPITLYGVDEVTASRFKWSLFDYGISRHYCPCHREGSIYDDLYQPAEDDSESEEFCQEGQWLIKSATHPTLPGIVLYREELRQRNG